MVCRPIFPGTWPTTANKRKDNVGIKLVTSRPAIAVGNASYRNYIIC